MKKRNLILVRHGQSEWNAKNLFTGWKDPDLTNLGLNEASNAGALIKETQIEFDEMFTSNLGRAQRTGAIILDLLAQTNILITKNEALLNVIDQPEVQTDIYVERGKNSALEYVERLGEVDNVGDLEKYGYGFFNVEKQ